MPAAKIAVVHPPFGGGGSDAVALWTVAALKDRYDVSLITSGKVNIQWLNESCGTDLSLQDFSVIQAPLPLGIGRAKKFAALRGSFIQWYCQRVASRFDLMISAYNPLDFGVPGIQLIADFSFDSGLRRKFGGTDSKLGRIAYGASTLRTIYLRLCSAISPGEPARWKSNLTVANSEWSRRVMDERYGVKSQTIYPPVVNEFPQVNFSDRTDGFVCLGRLVPEKGMEVVIEILRLVRQRGHNIHLHILGGGEPAYVKTLQDLRAQHGDWVILEGWVAGKKKADIIANHRFGISGRQNEPFGMAVAEMVKAGCIVFTPDNGGQVEIVNHENLVFQDVQDAVERICEVLSNPAAQDNLRQHLTTGAQHFSVEAFQRGIRNVVSEYFQGHNT